VEEIFPLRNAHNVTAGFKCPPEIGPVKNTAITNAPIIIRVLLVKEIVPINNAVPRNSAIP
jgi:hypothetical protein